MKNLFILIIFLCCTNKLWSTTYYFSSLSGNDANSAASAQNPHTPWKTIEKLNQIFSILKGGDSILFKSGEVFYGAINVTKSGAKDHPIVFSNYGVGNQPQITGFTQLAGWKKVGNAIWETALPTLAQKISMLVINNVVTPIGRFPNSDAGENSFLYIERFAGNTSIEDDQLPTNVDWTGAEVVIRKNRWVLDRNRISKHSGKAIYYESESKYPATKGFGYFIQNHPKTFDKEGEWFYLNNKVGIFSATDPSLKKVAVSSIEILVNVQNASHIVFHNLHFSGSNKSTFEIYRAQHIQVSNCTINFSGKNAVKAANTEFITIKNTNINFTNNNAFWGTNCVNTIIADNEISNTGIFPGMGEGGSGSYEAILIEGRNNLIEYNNINNVGYIPITFSGNNVTVRHNCIRNFALVKDDGGGIYTWNNAANAVENTGRKIIGNIITNGIGAGNGTDAIDKGMAHGIYIDDNASNVTITGNTVANCVQSGIYIHNAKNIVIENNTTYNNGKELVMAHDNVAPDKQVKDNVVTNNIFVSLNTQMPVAEFKTKENDLEHFGLFNYNYYFRPADDLLVINTAYKKDGISYGRMLHLGGWQANYNKDLLSKKSPVKIKTYKLIKTIGVDKITNGNFTANINGVSAYAPAGNIVKAWVGKSALNDGALSLYFSKLTASPRKASVILKIGSVTANKHYIVTFSLIGTTDNKFIEMFLRKSAHPYNDLSIRKFSPINNKRSEVEVWFTPNLSENDASLVFDLEEQLEPIYIDNLKLFEAQVIPINIKDSIRFESNGTKQNITIPLNSPYVDVKGSLYFNKIILKPYSSIILFKDDALTKKEPEAVNISPPIADAGNDMDIMLPQNKVTVSGLVKEGNGPNMFFNWKKIGGPEAFLIKEPSNAQTEITNLTAGMYTFLFVVTNNKGATSSDTLIVTVHKKESQPQPDTSSNNIELSAVKKEKAIDVSWKMITKANYKFYELEKSRDGVNFKKIGKINAQTNGTKIHSYILSDLNPLNGNNYYRIKIRTTNYLDFFSEIIKIDFTSSNRSGHIKSSGTENILDENSSIVQNKSQRSFISPNPSQSSVIIYFDSLIFNQESKLIIQSSSGSVIKTIVVPPFSRNFKVDVADLFNGEYIFTIIYKDNKWSEKFIKN